MIELILLGINGIVVLVVGLLLFQLVRFFRLNAVRLTDTSIAAETDLPSVSVCIPARNEQHALTDCLQRVLDSTYERLEILVLDDNSQDDTPALIRSFASEGVRFIKGTTPPKGWLGRNYALQQLLDEASGSYVLFIDIDTVLAPQAIQQLVRMSLSQGASMLSVIPQRRDGLRASVVFSPLRYFWEIVFHRKSWPATASSAWLIRRDALLHDLKGFTSVKNSAQPESKLAHALAQTRIHSVALSTKELGVAYEKKWRSQLLTEIRLLYPMLEKQPLIAFSALVDCLLLAMPFAIIVMSFMVQLAWWLVASAVLTALFSWVMYGIYTFRAWSKGALIGALLWPVIILQEACLVLASFIMYSRRMLTWKGRTIQPEVQN